jgi:centromeric protein E
VRDLLSPDATQLRLLDDPEVNCSWRLPENNANSLRACTTHVYPYVCHSWLDQKGTVVEKLTEETLRDKGHLLELLAVCEGVKPKLLFFPFEETRLQEAPR